jgi:hypothetical protein
MGSRERSRGEDGRVSRRRRRVDRLGPLSRSVDAGGSGEVEITGRVIHAERRTEAISVTPTRVGFVVGAAGRVWIPLASWDRGGPIGPVLLGYFLGHHGVTRWLQDQETRRDERGKKRSVPWESRVDMKTWGPYGARDSKSSGQLAPLSGTDPGCPSGESPSSWMDDLGNPGRRGVQGMKRTGILGASRRWV